MKTFNQFIKESTEFKVNMDTLLELAKAISFLCNGEYGYLYFNESENKIAIVLGDSNPFEESYLEQYIRDILFDDYKQGDLLNIEIDSEWVPCEKGDKNWVYYNPSQNKNKFITP